MTGPAHPDDVDRVRGSVWLLAAALALVGLAILLVIRPILSARRDDAEPARPPHLASAPPHALGGAPAAPPIRRADVQPVRRAPPAAPREAAAGAADGAVAPANAAAAVDAAADADADGEAPLSGIALFPPPGTKPVKRGIVVPDDFALPPGYVRHFQTTDDGQQLPAILMFHPDFEWIDADGRKVELPADRVVPPALAPPGLPLQMLDVPDAHVPTVEQPPPGAQFEPDAP